MFITVEELRAAIGFQAATMEAGKEEGEFDDELEAVISDVTDLVNSYIRPRYNPTDVSGSSILKRICTKICKYDVFSQYARNECPETVKEDKRDAMKSLEAIQRGKLELELAAVDPASVSSEFTSQDQVLGTYL